MTGPSAPPGAAAPLGRLWFYANYHCNLACGYCLTESAPQSPRRILPAERMLAAAREAAEIGFTDLGVTGGEPFLRPDMPETLARLAEVLPTIVLTNATLFHGSRIERLRPLEGTRVAVQVSLDSADATSNDALRAPDNYVVVVEAIPRLVELGIRVRVATTLDPAVPIDETDQARLCALHRSLGVADEDHVVRPVVRRGRADAVGMGVVAGIDDFPPELTITTDGAFWSPFGPTVRDGRLDTDLLLTRTTDPLRTPVEVLQRLVAGRPPGDDSRLGIR
jgi:pyruvate-formate lyase-activating enzyme